MENLKSLEFLGDYIEGRFVRSNKTDGEWQIASPADLKDVVISVETVFSHAERACLVAKKAYGKWAHTPLDERKNYLAKLKKVFVARADEMAMLISREMGKPLWEAKTEAAALAAKIDVTLEYSLRLIAEEKVPGALPGLDGYVRYKPRGVMAVIGPFNFPAHLANGHIIPALAAGNTIVFKPSEKTPGVGQLYAEMFHEAGFPPGVFNMVQGQAETGKRLVRDENVAGILFTGSYEVGLRIKQDTLEQYWKIVALEMGGKNTTIVWDDADMEKAVYETIIGAYLTSGQRCSCTSKIVLHKNIAEKFLRNFHENAKKLKIGHWSENPFMGPLISQDSVEKYLRFQEIAKREGAECIMRGKALEDTSHQGYYVTPSIYRVPKLNLASIYQQNEIFGPNVAVYVVDDFDAAIEIVNASGYGLAMSLFTKNKSLYEKALIDARVGLLNLNRTTNGASSKLPFGGMNKSGNDRPSGNFAIQYCAVPVATLEDYSALDKSKLMPGLNYQFEG